MPKLRKVSGAWRTVAARYRKIDGQWRRVKESYRKVDGIWVKTFESTFLETYVINPDPSIADAGVYFDASTNSYRAYIYGRKNTSETVEVGIRIGNLPANSDVSVKLATYDNITAYVGVMLFSRGAYFGGKEIQSVAEYFTLTSISEELVMVIRLFGTTVGAQQNFALSDVQINGESIPLP